MEDKMQIKKDLAEKLSVYIPAILKRFGEYMDENTKSKLQNLKEYENIIAFDDSGNVTAHASESRITMPYGAIKALDFMKSLPNSGSDKNHKTYTEETLIENDNTFEDYINHLLLTQADISTYFNELLLHETLHYCGSGGNNSFGAGAFREGLNEYLTRLVAKENGFITNGCGYPKEIKVVLEMEKVLGTKALTQISFLKDLEEINAYLKNAVGIDKTRLFNKVVFTMEQEFQNKYISKSNDFVGFEGAIKKTKTYRDIDYSKTFSLIEDYKNSCEEQSARS